MFLRQSSQRRRLDLYSLANSKRFNPGRKNFITIFLELLENILLPPPYLKLRLLNQSIKSSPKCWWNDSDICVQISEVDRGQIERSFNSLRYTYMILIWLVSNSLIWKYLSDPLFSETIGRKEKEAWDYFKDF